MKQPKTWPDVAFEFVGGLMVLILATLAGCILLDNHPEWISGH